MYSGSQIIDGPKPVFKSMIAAGTEAQGREVVDRYKDHGSDFIKVYSLLPRAVYFAVADEAHKRGIPLFPMPGEINLRSDRCCQDFVGERESDESGYSRIYA